jgi:acyl-CoA thioester hydrolase
MSIDQHKQLSNYAHSFAITTRWIDNDMFGHVNNVNYYAFFDSVVNQFLIDRVAIKLALLSNPVVSILVLFLTLKN